MGSIEKQQGGSDAQDTEEARVLSKSRCPHTGVVNFFTNADPQLAVGSIAEAGVCARYVWRCYVGDEASGIAADMALAEAHLRRAISGGDRMRSGGRSGRNAAGTRAGSYSQA